MKLTKNTLIALCASVVTASASLVVTSCGSDRLNEQVFDRLGGETYYKSEEEFKVASASVYAQLRAYFWNYYNSSEVSTDEIVVPTRGGDWGDAGRWRQLHKHTWDPTHSDLNGAYNDAYTGVARANIVLQKLAETTATFSGQGKDVYAAELRLLRAFYYLQLLDFFGGVPIVKEDKASFPMDLSNLPPRNTAAEVFGYIESELKAAAAVLPATRPATEYGRVTKGAANAMLTKLYLNGKVWSGTAKWAETIQAADAVISSGNYALANSYFDNFKVNNENSPELIFVAPFHNKDDLGFPQMNANMRSLHYKQLPQQPWNGFAATAEYYGTFEAADPRRNIFLVGQQYTNFDPTQPPLTDRGGNLLKFTEDIVDIESAAEGEGIRVQKWEIDPTADAGASGNDLILLRYADILLSKAEALNEQGDVAGAVAIINQVRTRPGSAAPAIAAASFDQNSLRDRILKERGYELAWEGFRRQDLLRMGKYSTQPRKFLQNTDASRNLFPLPQREVDLNDKLTQNPGY
jgi:hypothetical protein